MLSLRQRLDKGYSNKYINNNQRRITQYQEEKNCRCEFQSFLLLYKFLPVVFWNVVGSDLFFLTASFVVKHDLIENNNTCTANRNDCATIV